MFYDLNVPWTEKEEKLQRTIAFLDELGYDVVALSTILTGKIASDHTSPITFPTLPPHSRLTLLRRATLLLTDATTSQKLPDLRSSYDLIAARPTSDRSLSLACSTLDVDIISLDLTIRWETHFKYSTLASAIARGIKLEICYAQALHPTADAAAKRNLITNATQLIRVSRGRGLIFSSDAKTLLALRAPADIINLADVWGLGHERGKDGLTREPRSVVEFARLKKTSYKGVVDLVYGGEKPAPTPSSKTRPEAATGGGKQGKGKQSKRKGEDVEQTVKKAKKGGNKIA